MSASFGKSLFVSAVAALPVPVLAPLIVESIQSGTAFGSVLSSESAALYYFITWAFAFLAAIVAVSLSVAPGKQSKVSAPSNKSERSEEPSGAEGSETGTVKWFNVNKGFGFITTSAGDDIFVHFRSIRGRGRRSLRQGQTVRFDITQGDKGQQAENVSVV